MWEREAERWAAVSPWNKQAQLLRNDDEPRWPSLNGALAALLEHKRGRAIGSTLGAVLAHAARGEHLQSLRDPRKVAPRAAIRALEIVDVELALTRATASGADGLSAGELARAVLEHAAAAISIQALAERHALSAFAMAGLLRRVRTQCAEDLVQRGVIGERRRRADVATCTTWRSALDPEAAI